MGGAEDQEEESEVEVEIEKLVDRGEGFLVYCMKFRVVGGVYLAIFTMGPNDELIRAVSRMINSCGNNNYHETVSMSHPAGPPTTTGPFPPFSLSLAGTYVLSTLLPLYPSPPPHLSPHHRAPTPPRIFTHRRSHLVTRHMNRCRLDDRSDGRLGDTAHTRSS